MNLNQLASDVAEESSNSDPQYKQFSTILLMIIGTIIVELVKWFIRRYVTPKEAEKQFLEYYRKMNPVRQAILRFQIRHQIRKSGHELFSAPLIAGVLEKKFKQLTEDDINEIFKEIRNSKKDL